MTEFESSKINIRFIFKNQQKLQKPRGLCYRSEDKSVHLRPVFQQLNVNSLACVDFNRTWTRIQYVENELIDRGWFGY